jgi:hypothetical protein
MGVSQHASAEISLRAEARRTCCEATYKCALRVLSYANITKIAKEAI